MGIPNGTSKELRDLLMGLLKRNAADRFDFDIFFNHPFIRPVVEEPSIARVRTSPVKVPSADRGSRNTTPVATETKPIATPTQSREPTQKFHRQLDPIQITKQELEKIFQHLL